MGTTLKWLVRGCILASCLAFFTGCAIKVESPAPPFGNYQMLAVPQGQSQDHYVVLKCNSKTGDVFVIDCLGVTPQTGWKKLE